MQTIRDLRCVLYFLSKAYITLQHKYLPAENLASIKITLSSMPWWRNCIFIRVPKSLNVLPFRAGTSKCLSFPTVLLHYTNKIYITPRYIAPSFSFRLSYIINETQCPCFKDNPHLTQVNISQVQPYGVTQLLSIPIKHMRLIGRWKVLILNHLWTLNTSTRIWLAASKLLRIDEKSIVLCVSSKAEINSDVILKWFFHRNELLLTPLQGQTF